jgi:hypothetical protein
MFGKRQHEPYEEPASFDFASAVDLAMQHFNESPVVETAHAVTFGNTHHVHLNLYDGDIVVIGPDECLHIEM